MTVSVLTLGCRLNIAESEAMRARAEEAGFNQAGHQDVVIVNTCAVTSEAVRQARKTIRKLGRERPEARIVVTGCAAQIEPETFADMAEVSLVLGNAEKGDVAVWRQLKTSNSFGLAEARADKMLVSDIMAAREIAPHMAHAFREHTRAFLQVQNGCDHRCTFCVIPFGRGNSRSRAMGEVVSEVQQLVAQG
ncbi:MAG: tRNA (N(6)-L-threonylcarbamoyladenosine(37)-C(2))-methylthiotransferase MtaB, partial [Bosea sp. (in: a-proteobacteria)]